jgi:hypothetical protein
MANMNIQYKESEIYYHDYIKIIKFNDSSYKLIQFKNPVRKSGFEKDESFEYDFETLDSNKTTENQNEEYLRQSLSRTKKTIKEYALCNEFEYFSTLTFDRTKINACELETIKKNIGQWLNNYKKRVNKNLKYLLIPELHKDKKHFHLHGLISGIEDIKEFRKSSKGVMRYNWIAWEDKYGFNSLEKVKNTAKVSNYITKYITKELVTEYHKQRYLVSKGLKKPETIMAMENYTSFIPCDFENEYVKTLNIDSYDKLQQILIYISNTKNS